MNDISESLFRRKGLSLSGVYLSLILTATAAFQSHAQTPPEATTLALGKAVEREISGADAHKYSITLAEGQSIDVSTGL